MKCIVSGGTGFIGSRIVARLLQGGHEVSIWSRRPGTRTIVWDPLTGEPPVDTIAGADTIIHLAGERVAQRWSDAVKRRIRDSRVLGTRHLVDAIAKSPRKPRVLVSASAIGYYGERGDEVLTESSAPGRGFLVDVCKGWEAEALRATDFGVRVIVLRIGFVLGSNGGALGRMGPVFKAALGGRLGSGKQWMPWVHTDDLAELFVHAAENDISGVWNASAPNPVRNEEFTRAMASALHRPAIFPVPPFALKLVFGELGQHMLDSSRVVPAAALQAGFRFRYAEVGQALRQIFEA